MRPQDLKYTKTHEWVKVEGDTATIGITDFAASHLSDLVYLDLPEVQDSTTAGKCFAEIESVKAVADIYAPVTGEVVAINAEAPDDLEKISRDPFGAGWLVKIKLAKTEELRDLLTVEQYEKFVEQESKK
ncbi:MAG: glycine cleavage system protein GcvH [Planctomycetes bacterium]|nr:glycine cleavage system protein GcvH [Planctomycetota bacterium]MBI3847500.1 glycine cleavage system protein GcvH [Planctomycetota bacterium]